MCGHVAGSMDEKGFNPKREARPSQTAILEPLDHDGPNVSIPNGKPGPLRRGRADAGVVEKDVSIPNGKPGPLRPRLPWRITLIIRMFQSQTGSQALSDPTLPAARLNSDDGFNPKREARPSQTRRAGAGEISPGPFQSQTGSQALSDKDWQRVDTG